ncbi:VCBS repeat-containing protein [Aliifodinibius sp. S!AR15-10]|uniref:VCBS repeat-containing protein n=1 Tax=Aliifodinibius sp. S!AR15-10 TaxID=2950437 RepID=UPI002865B919|nr:VCBS repeat-containing protein [Aliifodinibius sp. S!AR15-10]MDR8389539.1 VCBS repeat-containing protein [Aliifodinibius sp. S!AR15-10]
MRKNYLPILFLLSNLLLIGCQKSDPSTFLFQRISPDQTNIHFSNDIEENSSLNMFELFYLYNGGGVAIGDINNDSLPDIFFSGNMVADRLYLNKGDFEFEEITKSAGLQDEGWSTGVNFVDINSDGNLDLYVCRSGKAPPEQRKNRLYINNGDLTFTESAEDFGIADASYSTQSAFFDYDKDGDLDLYLLNHSNEELQPNRIKELVTDGSGTGNDRLYQSNGDGTFRDVTKEAGIVYPGMGLGLGISDLNNDGWEDIYVANDFLANDYLYINNKDGTFREVGSQALKHHSLSSMGSDLADMNNDGWIDILVVDMLSPSYEKRRRMSDPMSYAYFERSMEAGYHPQYLRNMLQVNNGSTREGVLSFSEIGQYAGIQATGWSWAPLAADFDNDGYRDLWITNGYLRAVVDEDLIRQRINLERRYGRERARNEISKTLQNIYDYKRTDAIYRNNGDLTFEDKSETWKPGNPTYSNGAAYADLNNDGTLDIVVNHINEKAGIYRNNSDGNNYLRINLKGPGKNSYGLGTELKLYCDGVVQSVNHNVSRGYQSSMEYPIHFGLDDCKSVDSLRVVWPDGHSGRLGKIAVNQQITVDYNDASSAPASTTKSPDPLLADITTKLGLDYKHNEKFYNDFARQPLLPHKHSQMGPGLATADLNSDGLDDFYVAGAYDQSGTVFIQNIDGSFSQKLLSDGEGTTSEEMAPLFFDADADGDQDLYVTSGSNEFFKGSKYYQDRLYMNDGHGNFTLARDALPEMRTSGSTVMAADYDRDGDLDLFVGGRLQPLGKTQSTGYPLPPRSYILRNNEGDFMDVTGKVAKELESLGMVTSGLWTDFNNDGWKDLVLVGEYMEITFLKNREGKFENVTDQTGLGHTTGWWNSIAGGDFDRDGDIDYVAGNLGLNSRLQASASQPVTVYAKDFDRNRRLDPIITYYLNGTEYPIYKRDQLLEQIPSLRSRFPTYKEYAQTSFGNFISKEQLEDTYVRKATRFESSYIENLGNGKFSIKPLPARVQWAPVYGLEVRDINGDHLLDILAIGNSYAPEVITGRLDASVGTLLAGDGNGGFKPISHRESGFFVDGDGKGLITLQSENGKPIYIASQNNDSLKVFEAVSSTPGTVLDPPTSASHLTITYGDGSTEKRELYYGLGYLSQSTRKIILPKDMERMTLYNFQGEQEKATK